MGTGCTERQWVGNSDTPSLIRCNLNNPPPSTHAHFSTHQPPTYARALRIILKLTPIFIPPPYLTNIQFTPLVPVCLLLVHPVPLCFHTHLHSLCPLIKRQLTTFCRKNRMSDGEVAGKECSRCSSHSLLGSEPVSKIARTGGEDGRRVLTYAMANVNPAFDLYCTCHTS